MILGARGTQGCFEIKRFLWETLKTSNPPRKRILNFPLKIVSRDPIQLLTKKYCKIHSFHRKNIYMLRVFSCKLHKVLQLNPVEYFFLVISQQNRYCCWLLMLLDGVLEGGIGVVYGKVS